MTEQMMEGLLIEVLNMSLTASVMILAVLLARLILRNAPRIFSYVLWLAVLFRLLCPFSFESQLSLLGTLQSESAVQGRMEYIPADIGYQAEPEVKLPVEAVNEAVNRSLPAGNPETSVNPLQIVLYLAVRIWILGILGMLIYSGVSLWKLRRRLKTAVWEQGNIYRMPGRGTPFVYGLLRPRIYLPEGLKAEEQEYILLHEQIHIRRGDPVYRILGYIALCLHWFNPLVWLAFSFSGKDMEISCDEAVIRKMGNGVKKEYSASLLNAAVGSRIVKGIPLAFGESDTGSRIRHVLQYKKPAKILVGAAAALCVILAVVLLANPKEEQGEQAYYGIVREAEEWTGEELVVYLPNTGDVRIPECQQDYPNTEPSQSLMAGDLIKISFPADSQVGIQESDPAAFTEDASTVTVLDEGFDIKYEGEDYFLFAFPKRLLETEELVEGAGDMVSILRAYPEEERLIADTQVLRVDDTCEQVWVELSREQVEWFLTEYDMGISLRLEKQITAQGGTSAGEGTSEMQAEQGAGEGELLDSWGLDLTAIPDGTYRFSVRGISKSERCVNRYVCNSDSEESPELFFAEDCTYFVNGSMNRVEYEELTFEEFTDLILDGLETETDQATCYLTFTDGSISKAVLKSKYFKYGISYDSYVPESWLEFVETSPEMEGVDVLETYFTLCETEEADIGDGRGTERVEIYTGNIGDGDCGAVLFYSAQGELLHSETAHCSRAGWNNIYLGEAEGTPYILTVHIEDRDTYGGHGYQVYRLGRFGEVEQIAGSFFEFDDEHTPYNDDLFREWVSDLEYYLEHSRLILSSQEGEIRTEQICELDKYNYETLRRGK